MLAGISWTESEHVAFLSGLKALGEAHRFSAWKAFGTGFVAFLALFGLMIVVAIVFGGLFAALKSG